MLVGICIALVVIAIAMIMIIVYGMRLNSQFDDLIARVGVATTDSDIALRTLKAEAKESRWHARTREQVDVSWPSYEPLKCRHCDWVCVDCIQEARRESGLSTCKENKQKCKRKRLRRCHLHGVECKHGSVEHCCKCKDIV